MSDKMLPALNELANFVGESAFSNADEYGRAAAVNEIVFGSAPRLQRKNVNELLAAVMALSARTRRMLMPSVAIELDVFSPKGRRAVSVQLPSKAA
jgi:hypothetical protein